MADSIYKVIVAEDEELLLDNLVKKIENTNLGFKVVGTAQTGEQALALVKDFSPDLLVTDIKMPVMNGMELLTNVHERYPSVKVIIISGFSDFEYAKQAIKMQVCEYLLKPIDSDELYTALLSIKTKLELEQESYKSIFKLSSDCNTPEQIAHTLREYIVHNYTSEINLNLIANSMNYSSSYLTKVFCQEYDSTPSKYIISLRIQRAQALLLHNPELSIRQVGEAVGYPEQGYFSRIFKKQTGVSPFDFRENGNL